MTENDRLRDQVDECRHLSDRLQKSEVVVEKLKKKLDEAGEIRRGAKVGGWRWGRVGDCKEISHWRVGVNTFSNKIACLPFIQTTISITNSTLYSPTHSGHFFHPSLPSSSPPFFL